MPSRYARHKCSECGLLRDEPNMRVKTKKVHKGTIGAGFSGKPGKKGSIRFHSKKKTYRMIDFWSCDTSAACDDPSYYERQAIARALRKAEEAEERARREIEAARERGQKEAARAAEAAVLKQEKAKKATILRKQKAEARARIFDEINMLKAEGKSQKEVCSIVLKSKNQELSSLGFSGFVVSLVLFFVFVSVIFALFFILAFFVGWLLGKIEFNDEFMEKAIWYEFFYIPALIALFWAKSESGKKKKFILEAFDGKQVIDPEPEQNEVQDENEEEASLSETAQEIRSLDNFFDVACVILSNHIAKIDGEYSDEEKSAITSLFEVSEDDLELADRYMQRSDHFQELTKILKERYATDPDTLKVLISNLFEVAGADGTIDKEERTQIRGTALAMGIDDRVFTIMEEDIISDNDEQDGDE